MAAYLYLTNRMTALPLPTDRKETEWRKLLAIAKNNKFPVHLITRLNRHKHKTHTDKTDNKNKKKGYLHIPQPQNQKNHQPL
jgi:hypothetical protein